MCGRECLLGGEQRCGQVCDDNRSRRRRRAEAAIGGWWSLVRIWRTRQSEKVRNVGEAMNATDLARSSNDSACQRLWVEEETFWLGVLRDWMGTARRS